MRRRTRFSGFAACLGVVALGCAAAGAPTGTTQPAVPRPSAAASTPTSAPDAGAESPADAVAIELSISRAWEAWQSGDRAGALSLFRKNVTALEALPRALNPKRAQWKREAGVPRASVTGADGDPWRAIGTDKALFFVDGRGVPSGWVPGAVGVLPRFVPGTSLALAEERSVTIYDAATGKRVLSASALGSPAISPSGRLVAFVSEAADKTPAALHVWSTSTRTERRFPLASTESAVFDPLRFAPDESAVATPVLGDGTPDVYAIFDLASGKRIDVGRRVTASGPDFSPDGKLVASALPNVGDHGYDGTTTLLDRATGRRVASSGACSYPTSTQFSKSGKLLFVGDLRRVCVFEVPSLRLLAKSPEIRPNGGPDDDLQDVSLLRPIGNDVGFVAGTADGAVGLFRLPTAALLWRGRGHVTEGKDGRHYIYDATGATRVLLGFDDKLAVSSRIVSDAEVESGTLPELGSVSSPADAGDERTLEATACSVGPWVFPKEACVP